MLCEDCEKYANCTELCDQAEKIVNQDYVPQHAIEEPNSKLIEETIHEYSNSIWDMQKDNYTSNELKNLIISLYNDGKSVAEIQYHLPCSHPYISKIIKKYKSEKVESDRDYSM